MKVNTVTENGVLKSLFEDETQIITLDANFIIAPDRTAIGAKKEIPFSKFKDIWLEPLFNAFPKLAVHSAVYDEIVGESEREYINKKAEDKTPQLIVFYDKDLSAEEMVVRNTKEAIIATYTGYNPEIDNKDDRGEVKTLAYISTKDLIYFASNDDNAIKLVEESEKLRTSLDNIKMLKFYELIYYFYKKDLVENGDLRVLYKYLYHLTKKEKGYNPVWSEFIAKFERLYK